MEGIIISLSWSDIIYAMTQTDACLVGFWYDDAKLLWFYSLLFEFILIYILHICIDFKVPSYTLTGFDVIVKLYFSILYFSILFQKTQCNYDCSTKSIVVIN